MARTSIYGAGRVWKLAVYRAGYSNIAPPNPAGVFVALLRFGDRVTIRSMKPKSRAAGVVAIALLLLLLSVGLYVAGYFYLPMSRNTWTVNGGDYAAVLFRSEWCARLFQPAA